MKLKILSKTDGFRRLGYTFSSKEAVYIDAADLKKEQIAILQADPGLVVVETEGKESTQSTSSDMKLLEKQLKEAQSSLDDLTKQHGKLLQENGDLKEKLAAEKDAHAKTKAAANAAPAAKEGKSGK